MAILKYETFVLGSKYYADRFIESVTEMRVSTSTVRHFAFPVNIPIGEAGGRIRPGFANIYGPPSEHYVPLEQYSFQHLSYKLDSNNADVLIIVHDFGDSESTPLRWWAGSISKMRFSHGQPTIMVMATNSSNGGKLTGEDCQSLEQQMAGVQYRMKEGMDLFDHQACQGILAEAMGLRLRASSSGEAKLPPSHQRENKAEVPPENASASSPPSAALLWLQQHKKEAAGVAVGIAAGAASGATQKIILQPGVLQAVIGALTGGFVAILLIALFAKLYSLVKRKRQSTPSSRELVNQQIELLCPIGQEVMTDPVKTEAGKTYERANIETWIQTQQRASRPATDPLTRAPITLEGLRPDVDMRAKLAAAGHLVTPLPGAAAPPPRR